MRCPLCAFLLMVGASLFAQQIQPPSNPPPYTTPPTFPEEQGRGMPPDTKAPPPQEFTTTRVAMEIQEKLKTEPALADADVNVKADDSFVVLSGTVNSDRQHELALRIAKSYAGKRRVVDKIQIREQT
jgi:hypothetical protein